MIIDSHQHVFWLKRDDAGLIKDMDDHGIDVAWLLTWEIPPFEDAPEYHGSLNPLNMRGDGTHAGITLGDLLLARQRHPGRFIVGYCPHPTLGRAPDLFEAAYYIHHVRICAEWKFRIPFDAPPSIELFRRAGKLKCPVVLHLDVPWLNDANGVPTFQRNWYGGTVANLERALELCPDTIFIGHAPGFWREISGNAETDPANYPGGPITPGGKLFPLFDKYPNLYADLSAGSGRTALKRDPNHAVEFLSRYADRLLFARDQYGTDLHQFLESLSLPQTIWQKLYFENANRLIPLKEALR